MLGYAGTSTEVRNTPDSDTLYCTDTERKGNAKTEGRHGQDSGARTRPEAEVLPTTP